MEDEEKQREQIITKDDPYIRGKIAEMFGHPPNVDKYDTEMSRMLEYAATKGATTPEDILWEIRRLDGHLMSGGYSEDRMRDISNYLFLLMEKDKIDTSIRKMEGLDGATKKD